MNTHTVHLQRYLKKCLSSFGTASETNFAAVSINRPRFTHKDKTELCYKSVALP